MRKSSPSKFGVIAVLSTLVIVILIAILTLFSFYTQPEAPKPAEVIENPIAAVSPDQVDPALAIAQLGGIAPLDVIDQAIEKSRPGTALAAIVYSPAVSGRDTAGTLLLLADKFQQKDDLVRAKLCYKMVGTLATLSPDLSDTLRADLFLQTGIGLTGLDDPVLAKIYLDQAYLVTTKSNYLQAAHRRSIFEQLHQAYLNIQLNEQARQALDQSLNTASLQSLPEDPLVLPLGKTVALPATVQEAEANRWQAAQIVIKNLVELGGVVKPENLAALRAALLAEDQAKTAFFNEALAAEPQLSGKVNLVQAKINWQSTRYRIAKLGFGLSLVPEWEQQAEQIRSDLTAGYEELYRLYSDLIVAMPDAAQIDRATEESLRRQLLAGQLGQYPNYQRAQLKTQLLNITARLAETQPGTDLRASYLTVDGVEYFTLISDEDILNQ